MWTRTHFVALGALALVLLPFGCLDRPVEPNDPRTTTVFLNKLPSGAVDKIDLLLMIDNSRSMADKQAILAEAVPDLVGALLNPRCLDGTGRPIRADLQPTTALGVCPRGSEREFKPVLDVHIGIVSSSLGGHGSDACPATEVPSENDGGHLVQRQSVTSREPVPTYADQGFLVWDPAQKLDPPGENDSTGLGRSLTDLVRGTGQIGCAYESQLESWYRFLVDPEPSTLIVPGENYYAVASGRDDQLLEERKNFLRPDSLLTIILLTDENDCSVEETGHGYLTIDSLHTARARQECAVDVNDPCCKSCGEELGDCPVDPSCGKPFDALEDPTNLRCYRQRERYGRDYLHPVERYVEALTKDTVLGRDGRMYRNPVFAGGDWLVARTPESNLVFLAGIVGVPWQDIARRDALGRPDLLTGKNAAGKPVGGFASAEEMRTPGPDGKTTWDLILGEPSRNVEPLDPLMRESITPRTGQNPVLDAPLAAANSTNPVANPINGHEWNTEGNDLQYACTFPLPAPRPCEGATDYCECADPNNQNPLCQDATGRYTTTQLRAHAYPSLRELAVLKGLGDQGIVASVCPAQLSDKARADYGYRPAMGAIIERLKHRLLSQCLPLSLEPNADGDVPCLILEAKTGSDPCLCDAAARRPVPERHLGAKREALEDGRYNGVDYTCICEIPQLEGRERTACQEDTSKHPEVAGKRVDGFCYVDAMSLTPIGNPELVAGCPETERREIRFVGAAQPEGSSTLYITCSQ